MLTLLLPQHLCLQLLSVEEALLSLHFFLNFLALLTFVCVCAAAERGGGAALPLPRYHAYTPLVPHYCYAIYMCPDTATYVSSYYCIKVYSTRTHMQ